MPRSRSSATRSEFEKIATIARALGGAASKKTEVAVGIGDDAAVLSARGRLVWTIDAQVEGVHFRREWLTLADIGFRSLQAALSDVAAMGARPLGALANLTLPPSFADRDLERLVRGQAEASRGGCPVIGGNLSRGSELSITTTVLGVAEKPLLRSTARAGDELWLCGEVGSAALGLAALERALRPSRALAACIARWRRPQARVEDGLALARRARACIDVSDGLSGDAEHIARASAVRVVIDADGLSAALAAHLQRGAAELGLDPLALALTGGEDYALLASGPSRARPPDAAVIGRIETGRGVYLEQAGKRKPVLTSFDHFENSQHRGRARRKPRRL